MLRYRSVFAHLLCAEVHVAVYRLLHRLGPNSVALRTPCHRAAGCGAFQRSGPVGGAAKGMPLNTFMPDSQVPSTTPQAVLTCGPCAVATAASSASASDNIDFFIAVYVFCYVVIYVPAHSLAHIISTCELSAVVVAMM